MSPFTILFIAALFSFALHQINYLKTLSLIALLASMGLSLLHFTTPLEGFGASDAIVLFEVLLFIVLSATVLVLDAPIAITQTLFIAAASVLLLESTSLLTFIISFEALSIISFVLVSFIRNTKEAEGAVKMFISGSTATGIILLGAALYLLDGHSLQSAISTESTDYGVIGIWIVLAGLFYKLTIVPMHTWAADSYAEVRPAYAAILSGVAKTVAVVAVFKIFSPFLDANYTLSLPILLTLALVTMTLGNFLALFAKSLDKLLSYSSIAHAGYMLLAFGALKSSYAPSALLYLAVAYIFMQTALFLMLDKLTQGRGNLRLEDLKGLMQKDKLSALFLTIQLFSLAGVPLLAGFLAKAVLIYAVVDAGFIFVALFTLLNSALSVAYYAWVIKHIYFDEANEESTLTPLSRTTYLSQSILLFGTLYFGIFATTVFSVNF